MHPTLCSKCKKNVAVIFVTKIEGGKTLTEGLCLKCAKEMGIKPVDDIMKRMGISEDELEGLNSEMTEAFQGMESMMAGDQNQDDDSDEIESQTATFPFLNKLFGGERQEDLPAETPGHAETAAATGKSAHAAASKKKHKFLDTYCLNLTQKARDRRPGPGGGPRGGD